MDTPQGAAELAESLLPPLRNRWLHTQAVVARAQEASPAVPEEDRDLLGAAAWLHDLSYAPELSEYLGQHDPSFTLRTYTHLMPNSETRTRAAVDRVLRGPDNPQDGPDTAHGPGQASDLEGDQNSHN
ncbi:hypothetical protein RKD32_001779 [Streptomyces sp. SAI-195]|uniref:hypothetical protein n=1 Tax=unclassified Streptomyces TaxID=2593676 RepID=UPI003C7E23CB